MFFVFVFRRLKATDHPFKRLVHECRSPSVGSQDGARIHYTSSESQQRDVFSMHVRKRILRTKRHRPFSQILTDTAPVVSRVLPRDAYTSTFDKYSPVMPTQVRQSHANFGRPLGAASGFGGTQFVRVFGFASANTHKLGSVSRVSLTRC